MSISNAQIAYEKLLDLIRSGDLKPSARIREAEVAELVGASRTPVREAIRKLESDGIIEHRPRVGAVVKSLSHQELVELYEMRVVLERTAAEMAAKHASDAEIDEMRELTSEMAENANDPIIVANINIQFHKCIFMSARNRFLWSSAQTLSNALLVLGPTTLDSPARVKSVCEQHKAITDALSAGDAAEAGDAAAIHIETSLRHRLKAMRQ
ncbi:GntR family transcriptional regulator [Amylibacter sp. SFDW26]|uniref:GntR family transcriptional regulator n=1 Tax=Amylibacter sp. SFDW26 TaxID=2652722 RepID=UPI001261687E|nr:GntR family transcriptional regulator [Amylibacter sp. SFDW26]KAB7610504.1 GntR family transcriptional regulator [Amylibacter sp. SFDW26]